MTELERLELALRSIKVDDTWTPTELLDAIIEAVMLRNMKTTVEKEGPLEDEVADA